MNIHEEGLNKTYVLGTYWKCLIEKLPNEYSQMSTKANNSMETICIEPKLATQTYDLLS